MKRVKKDTYAMMLAHIASTRSEDPVRKVGACLLDDEGRILATGYNGLPFGIDVADDWWTDDHRRTAVIHAEMNGLALVQRGKVRTMAVTTAPCRDCARNIIAHGVKRVIFGEHYYTDTMGLEILENAKLEVIYIANQFVKEAIQRSLSPTCEDSLDPFLFVQSLNA